MDNDEQRDYAEEQYNRELMHGGDEPLFTTKMTLGQELRSLRWICARVLRLSPASRRWLARWITEETLR